MKIKGEVDDLQVVSPRDPNGKKSATFNFLTRQPMDVLKVRISPDQVDANVHQEIAKLEGQEVELLINYRDQKFQGENGQMVSINGFGLHKAPSQIENNGK